MRVVVNGHVREVPDGATLADVVSELGPARPPGVAVAVNGEVVRRSEWGTMALGDGDRVEVVAAIQGG